MNFQKILVIGAIVVGLTSVCWILLCALMNQTLANELKLDKSFNYSFDYVVVGSGSSGSVVASLLAKHSNSSILLIEAGDKFGFLSKIPLLTTFQQKGVNDWSFLSEPQKHSSRGLEEQRQCLPRGKGLGGSSLLNYMLHHAGEPLDFDLWSSRYKLTDWQWSAVKPFVEASHPKRDELFDISRGYSKLTEAMHLAESELSHKGWRFRRSKYTVKNGIRHSVLQRFLEPVMHKPNLRILTNALARNIHCEGNRATALVVGVKEEDSRKEHIFHVRVRRELILALGSYQTPQLLMVSGIGDRDFLSTFNISVHKHLPMVGANLHDHMNLPLYVSIEPIGPTLNQRALFDPFSLFGYLSSGSGHLGNFGVVGHVDSAYEDHFGVTVFGAGAIDETALMSISNFRRSHFRALFPRYHNASQEGFVLISSCLQPTSRGTVRLASNSMRRNPLIDPNYLSSADDINCTVKAIRAAVTVITSDAFASLKPRLHWPRFKECEQFGPFERDFRTNQPSDEYLECVLRHVGLGSHHPGGSCSMGVDERTSVVDRRLRVHGFTNLRIVDASVQPTPISGNPHAMVVAMAVRAATIILKDEQYDQSTKTKAKTSTTTK